ncbi:MAG: hypothetical protein CR997_01860 [Acidobacteria bacterium]|nr:MAG: hypothetical protein CR997_01860 [Acidobacteriota bacterium]
MLESVQYGARDRGLHAARSRVTLQAPLSLYIHVPFCRSRCHYCHFDIKVVAVRRNTKPSLHKEWFENYTKAVQQELIFYRQQVGDRPLQSVYFGGGTPSFLPLELLCSILDCVARHFRLDEDCEISVEANPEDVSETWVAGLRGKGVTRLSLGVQSTQAETLKAVRRNHTPEMVFRALEQIGGLKHGCSVDYILGLPFQERKQVERDLAMITACEPQHLSLYLLERDIPTPLDRYPGAMPTEDQQAEWFEAATTLLKSCGYKHYEISNFCQSGCESVHNSNYWKFGDYLGVGPAAHGRLGKTYWSNHTQLARYLESVHDKGTGECQRETWSDGEFRRQKCLQGLRLLSGIPLSWVTQQEKEALEELADYALVSLADGKVKLTERGILLANEVFQVFISS